MHRKRGKKTVGEQSTKGATAPIATMGAGCNRSNWQRFNKTGAKGSTGATGATGTMGAKGATTNGCECKRSPAMGWNATGAKGEYGESSFNGGSSSSGGIGANVDIQSDSNFAGMLPDEILVAQTNAGQQNFNLDRLHQVIFNTWMYMKAIMFNLIMIQLANINNGVGTYTLLDGATTLQNIIDNGHAIYYGGGSTSDAGDSVGANFSSLGNTDFFKSLTDGSFTCSDQIITLDISGNVVIMN